MAGYPPQQHYAAVHQPTHERFGAPAYHLPHAYPSLVPNAEQPYHFVTPQAQSQPQHPPPRSPKMQQQPMPRGHNTHNHSNASHQQHSMHHSHAAPPDRGPGFDPHRTQPARPPSQVMSQASQAGPSLPRQPIYAPNASVSQHSVQAPVHHSNAAVPSGHSHTIVSAAPHSSQSHTHSHSLGPHPQANYGVPMHPHDYDLQHAPPGLGNHSGGPRMANQHMPTSGLNGAGNTAKRSNGAVREKERDGGAPARGAGGVVAKGGAGVKRAGQEKQSSGKVVGGAAVAAVDKTNPSMLPTANEEPLLESKKIRKRKEVVDRIHRVHWDTLENREILYHDLQHKLSVASTTLLLWPSNSRSYLMALHRLNLEKDAQLRQSALLHAHQVESARTAYEQETQKVEDEARNSKKLVREKLLAAVEDRRRRLREDKESGEGMSDTLLDSSTRPHATRKLRNKGTGSSKRGGDSDAALAARVAGTNGGTGISSSGSLLGLLLSGVNGASSDGTSTPRGVDPTGLLGGLTSMAEFNQLNGGHGAISALPPSNFDSAANSTVSLLQMQGAGGGMGDSSYMSGTRAALQGRAQGKKKPGGKGSLANAGTTSGANGGIAVNGNALNASGADDDDDRNKASNPRAIAAAATAAAAAASLAIGTGRLRWEPGKSIAQLTSAKDIEVESDLINIRKTGGKRRRR